MGGGSEPKGKGQREGGKNGIATPKEIKRRRT